MSPNLAKPKFWLASTATLLFAAGCSGTQGGSDWAGTWEIQDPQTQDSVTIVLTEDGKAYVNSPLASTDTPEYLELPIARVSDESALPENARVVTLEEAMAQSMDAARESEGQTYVGALARAQQAYYLENERFAESLEELQLGLQSETENYQYAIASVENDAAYMTATAKQDDLKSFSSLVYVEDGGTQMLLCGTDDASKTAPERPEMTDSGATCASGSSPQ
ncbi:Type IV pilin PilA [Geitlerinema sp. FC II]|nr:type IV pilin-like G/H family protein [Geitlerinema sp. CS-897]PPT07792.1 Type IV pilin PilA [Geitlerinema sp. FC II]